MVAEIDPGRERRLKCNAAGRAIVDAQGLLWQAKVKLEGASWAARELPHEARSGLVAATAFLESSRESLEEAYAAIDEHASA